MKKNILLILSTIFIGFAQAQTNQNLYNFRNVAQSNYLNPGIRPQANITFGLPSVYTHFNAPNIGLRDFFIKGESPDTSVNNFLRNGDRNLNDINFVNQVDVLFAGFAIKKNYFSLGIQVNTEFNASIPKDIIRLGTRGNFNNAALGILSGDNVNLSNARIDLSSWIAFGLGYTREINRKISVGARVNYLYGLANLNTEKSSFIVRSNDQELYASAEYKINSAGFYSAYQKVKDSKTLSEEDFTKQNGSGFSFDFGGQYKFNQHLSVSASAINLGWITWDNNTRSISRPFTEYRYTGIDVVVGVTPDSVIKKRFEEIGDSLQNYNFKPVESSGSYTTSLNGKMYLGGQYAINYNNMFDVVLFNNFNNNSFNPAVTLAFTKKAWTVLDLRLSGTYYNKTISNIGFGFSLNLGPFQTYIFTDNIVAPLTYLAAASSNQIYDQGNYFNLRTGVNWNFGRNRDRDGDGVIDKLDKCKKRYGSWELEGCSDMDKDGVPDDRDSCINVPGRKCAYGCPDKDKDCVPDDKDSCVSDSGSVKLFGCPDFDKDGVTDKKDSCPSVAGTIALNGCPDKDGDGVTDLKDSCPTVAGRIEVNGCPDIDNDGVPDYQDSCKLAPGLKEFNGCPDKDGDGVPDKKDDCPTDKGPKELNGCPDTDGDGLIDKLDSCIDVPGPLSNKGCPVKVKEAPVDTTKQVTLTAEEKKVLREAFSNLEFESGTTQIKLSSLESLQELAQLLVARPTYKLLISGHTDSQGNAQVNKNLSLGRANAIKNFLISEGVAKNKLTAKGFGSSKPVASNKTEEGRARNRRVEFKIIK